MDVNYSGVFILFELAQAPQCRVFGGAPSIYRARLYRKQQAGMGQRGWGWWKGSVQASNWKATVAFNITGWCWVNLMSASLCICGHKAGSELVTWGCRSLGAIT